MLKFCLVATIYSSLTFSYTRCIIFSFLSIALVSRVISQSHIPTLVSFHLKWNGKPLSTSAPFFLFSLISSARGGGVSLMFFLALFYYLRFWSQQLYILLVPSPRYKSSQRNSYRCKNLKII